MAVSMVATDTLHLDILPRATRKAFLLCTKFKIFKNSQWYLAGGTALALQVGHRQSLDLDFFISQIRFRMDTLEEALLLTREWKTTLRRQGTLYGVLQQAKMSFIAYPFFRPTAPRVRCGNIKMLFPTDIAAMKIIAISQRGRKRDFVDLYWYGTHRERLYDVVRRAIHQYPGQENNVPHILKSLTYFADAEADPMPRLFFPATWVQIKRYFQTEVPKITREFLGLR